MLKVGSPLKNQIQLKFDEKYGAQLKICIDGLIKN